MIKTNSEIRVRYAETDKMGIVHHSRYLEWFEVARTDLMREIGMPYAKCEELGISMPLLEAFCKFFKPSLYDEILKIEARVEQMPRASIILHYTIFRNGEKLTEGFTKHAFVNSDLKPMRLPSFLKEKFVKYF